MAVILTVVTAAGAVIALAFVALTASVAGASPRCTQLRAGATVRRPSRREQEKVLDAAYARMLHDSYCTSATPGRQDVLEYGIGRLWSRGIDGAGTTIALAEAWDDPSINRKVDSYDRYLGLPDPQISTIYPSGDHRRPGKCSLPGGCNLDVNELGLDVDSAHLVAPYAKILIFVTPENSEVHEDPANAGLPEMMQGVEAISGDHLANVISFSYGNGEGTYPYGPNEATAQDPGELAAAAAGIPVVAATGDCGPVVVGAVPAPPSALGPCNPISARREISTPSDSPWVLAVGGSTPSATGSRIVPFFLPGAAGFSSIFTRPGYQGRVGSITHSRWRSVPDITMDDSVGTSESAPLMAGVLALATQTNGGRDLGPINTALYDTLGPKGAADGIVDITGGTNSLTTPSGKLRVRGYTAHKGFDVASGWGTVNAPRFVPALVRATRASHDEAASRAQAAAALTTLGRAIRFLPAAITSTATARLSATGFEPLFPVTLTVDGRKVATLHADRHGDVSDTLVPSRLHLRTGANTVTLTSMLITVTGHLTVR